MRASLSDHRVLTESAALASTAVPSLTIWHDVSRGDTLTHVAGTYQECRTMWEMWKRIAIVFLYMFLFYGILGLISYAIASILA